MKHVTSVILIMRLFDGTFITVQLTNPQHETHRGTTIDGRYDTFTANECNILLYLIATSALSI